MNDELPNNTATNADTPKEAAEAPAKSEKKSPLKQPVFLAAGVLGLCVIGLIFWLESGRIYVELPAPEVTYELLPNDGLTEGVPVAIKVADVSVFRIDDPMTSGGAERAKQVQADLQAAIEEAEDEPAPRTITIDLESAELPAIVQTNVSGEERRVLIQLTEGDLIQANTDDAKWLARLWAERLTDALKVTMFGEAPSFTQGTEFGEALELLYDQARVDGPVSRGSLNDAYENLGEPEQVALANFPPQPEDPSAPNEDEE